MEKILRTIEKFIPKKIYKFFQPAYHLLLSSTGAVIYNFPTRKIKVVGITGTKGKTTTAEIVNAILTNAGYKTALAGTLRFKIGKESKRNLHKMTMPGRFFMQKFLSNAVKENCDWVVVEMTSEGAKQFRHKFMSLDALIITNISPEHIESHGSYEKYIQAKLSIVRELNKSEKKDKTLIVNNDDELKNRFLDTGKNIRKKFTYSKERAEPVTLSTNGSSFVFNSTQMKTNLPGMFNVYNILAAATFAKAYGINNETIQNAVEVLSSVRGRMEKIDEQQNFTVIVDYAHTKDSLEKAYGAYPKAKKICVLGSTGGGRDRWKRKEMGAVADKKCEHIILTNEDPYGEDPRQIIDEVAEGIKNTNVEIIIDRREAIKRALTLAKEKDVVFITGKGTDPYIMEANNIRTPWDDATVAREELQRLIR